MKDAGKIRRQIPCVLMVDVKYKWKARWTKERREHSHPMHSAISETLNGWIMSTVWNRPETQTARGITVTLALSARSIPRTLLRGCLMYIYSSRGSSCYTVYWYVFTSHPTKGETHPSGLVVESPMVCISIFLALTLRRRSATFFFFAETCALVQ